ncbi:putative galactose oxidase, partial [Tanacetum coccineum]
KLNRDVPGSKRSDYGCNILKTLDVCSMMLYDLTLHLASRMLLVPTVVILDVCVFCFLELNRAIKRNISNARTFEANLVTTVCFCAYTGKVIAEFPELPGGSRNYQPYGMSALFPLKLTLDNRAINAEIVVCGGNAPNAYAIVDAKHAIEKQFLPALKDCNNH